MKLRMEDGEGTPWFRTAIVDDRYQWFVDGKDKLISIPPDQLGNLTDAQIGRIVRRLLPEMERASALARITHFFMNCPDSLKPWMLPISAQDPAPESWLRSTRQWRKLLIPVLAVGHPLGLKMAEVLDSYDVWRAAYEEKHSKRKGMQRGYEKRLVRIGRRDGFKCKQCGTSDELEIDHVVAVSRGGSNDDDNLQLLCKACNGAKGDA